MNNSNFSEKQLDEIADDLANQGYTVLENAIDFNVLNSLQQRALALSCDDWTEAGVGRASHFQIDKTIRSDKIHWLSEQNRVEANYLDIMNEMRLGLNQRLFLGLFDYESHFSVYAKGQFYAKHIDALKGKSNRVLSTVTYLNKDWQSSDAGQLKLYQKNDQPLTVIEPRFASLVIFLSEEVPHEVLAANKERYSIAGWFRVNSNRGDTIDPVK